MIRNLQLVSNGNLLSCSDDKTVKLWQIETGKMLKSIEFNYQVYCMRVLNKNLLAIGLQNGKIKIYDLSKKETVKTIRAHSKYLYRLNVLSNGNLLSGSYNGEIKLWKILD